MLITGAAGRIGRAIHEIYPEARGLDLADGDLVRTFPPIRPDEDTVIHLAGYLEEDLAAAGLSLRMTLNVMQACRVTGIRRFIIASSVRADEALIGFPVSYYGAGKAAQEAMLKAWCAEDERRIGVALRFGHFCPGSAPPVLHEAQRLDESMLAYWVGAALTTQRCGFAVWNAVGQAQKSPAAS